MTRQGYFTKLSPSDANVADRVAKPDVTLAMSGCRL